MPVRVTIHSSFVSTICSKSWFVRTRSGTYLPVPRMPTGVKFIMQHSLPAKFRGNRMDKTALQRCPCLPYRVFYRIGVRGAVAFQHQPVNAEQRRAAMLCVIKLFLEADESGLQDGCRQLVQCIARKLLLQGGENGARRPLHRFEQNISDKAVADEHVACAVHDIARFHVADEVNR